MATNEKDAATTTSQTSTATSRYETGLESDTTTSADVTGDKKRDRAVTANQDGASLEFSSDGPPMGKEAKEGAAKEGVRTEDDLQEPEEAAEGEQQEQPEAGEGDADADLGAWKKDDPEIAAKFEARYFSKDGSLNRDALSKEFWEAYRKDPKSAALKPATYEFLKDTLGISQEFAKEVERALVKATEADSQQFFSRVGGKPRFDAAVKWGTMHYTPPQKARFNEAMRKGGPEWDDAVDALMARFDKANPRRFENNRRGPPRGDNSNNEGERRSSSPRLSAGDGAAGGGGVKDGFKTREEYQDAWRKALDAEKAAKTPDERRAAKRHIEDIRRRARSQRFM